MLLIFLISFSSIILSTTYSSKVAASVVTVQNYTVSSGNHTQVKSWIKCTSEIYCTGELLHDVQLMNLFKDSKIFVDFRLKHPEKTILAKYKALKEKEHGIVRRAVMKEFVEENFERGNELESWVPPDWTRTPSILNKVSDPDFKKWVADLNVMWRVLARRVRADVESDPGSYSLIYVPNGFIIPGGRFTELYYWDTYWIINGLLICDMKETAKGIIENLIHLVKLFGHVPNGSRVYYITRSQPPLLIQMMNNYYKDTNDWKFVEDNLEYLSKEFDFWWDNHMVTISRDGQDYKLARYFSYDPNPRPESYREDYLVAHDLKDEDEQMDFYIKVRSAAETGWDFSSRWFVRGGTNIGNLSDIAAPQIIPVDLNSFLQMNADILGDWHNKVGNWAKSREYKLKADLLLEGISKVLWSEVDGMWFDFDSVNNIPREFFYASNLTPLFTFSYPKTWSRTTLSDRVIDYLRLYNIEEYIGGIPTSLEQTGEQWDFPNAWAPLQAIIVQGLDKLGTDEAAEEAYRLVSKWLQSTYKGYKSAHTMFEKYDVLLPGQSGEGGEYIPQTGFGWTNGVILEFFNRYGKDVEPSLSEEVVSSASSGYHGSRTHKKEGDIDDDNNTHKGQLLNHDDHLLQRTNDDYSNSIPLDSY